MVLTPWSPQLQHSKADTLRRGSLFPRPSVLRAWQGGSVQHAAVDTVMSLAARDALETLWRAPLLTLSDTRNLEDNKLIWAGKSRVLSRFRVSVPGSYLAS